MQAASSALLAERVKQDVALEKLGLTRGAAAANDGRRAEER
jgi:hypothetical protein